MLRRSLFLVLALFGCSSSSTEPGTSTPVDSGSDVSVADTGGVVEETATDSGTDAFTPDLGAEAPTGGGCFSTSTATTETCKTACMPYDACTFSFGGTCASGCTTRAAIMEKCATGAGSCAALEACVKCALICEQADSCPGTLSAATCCGNCVNRPECFDSTLPVCDAIRKSDVGCPPKMM
jgi:hypothetical protein